MLDAAFSPNGQWLATASTDQQVRVWDIERGTHVTPPLWHETTASRVAFTPDGTRLVTTSANDVVRLWDLPATTGVMLSHGQPVRLALFSPDGKRLLTATTFTVQLWDVAGDAPGKPLFVWAPGAQMYHAAFSPDGAYVVTASQDRLARL